ncbi:hypothetical protein TNCT_530821 [Trichonephila clavata]|uniref:Uncharacterized protein n=1 Tax=Trichonephila clavata TaxID=2740835 RepID=A0A8X6FQQ1_TRICU|nr:hypothetical protein TNCT_530821 [Trichonephila clavata]
MDNEEKFKRLSDRLWFEHKTHYEGKKKIKRGQNSYKKSHSNVDFDLKHDSKKEPWEGDSQRGVGKKVTGCIQKETLDLKHNGRGGEKGFLQKELWDGDS